MSDQQPKDNITISKQDYTEIVSQLQKLSVAQPEHHPIKNYQMMVLTRAYWDNFLSKLITSIVSVKMWILFAVLYYPYQLVKLGKISGDNYSNILLVVAPIVLGLREFAKASNAKIVAATDSSEAPTSSESPTSAATLSSTTAAPSKASPTVQAAQGLLKTIRQRFNV